MGHRNSIQICYVRHSADKTILAPLQGLWIACEGKRHRHRPDFPCTTTTWAKHDPCCSILLVLGFFEKLSEMQGVEYPTDIPLSFHLFDTITEMSQLVHQ